MYAEGQVTMLQDVYNLLLLQRLEPRWVNGELHVDEYGRAFAVTEHPDGVAVCKRTTTAADDKVFAYICEEPDQALAALRS
jgi:hypothetical protein